MPHDRRLAVAALLFAVANAPAQSSANRPLPPTGSTLPTDGNAASQPLQPGTRAEPSPDDSATHSALSW